DFGLVVDSAVVMIENVVRHLAHDDNRGRSRVEVVRDAAIEVRRPTMFGELIIMIVYLPILTLEGVEGKLFRPMALTVIFALAGSQARAGQPAPAQARRGARAAARSAGELAVPAGAAGGAAAAGGGGRPGGLLAAGGGDPGPGPRLGVRPAAVGRGAHHRHRPPGRHEPRRIAPAQHAHGADPSREVSRRDRARLEPLRH